MLRSMPGPNKWVVITATYILLVILLIIYLERLLRVYCSVHCKILGIT